MAKVERDGTEAENAKRLDKLPPEVWEKILDPLENEDLFPLALSCRYFRQKQKELVARSRQSGPESGKPCMILKTNLRRNYEKGQPASLEYLKFCSKDKVSKNVKRRRAQDIRALVAFPGHLPLLQEVLSGMATLLPDVPNNAGETSFSLSVTSYGF